MASGDFSIADTHGSVGIHLKMIRYPLKLRSAFGCVTQRAATARRLSHTSS